MIGITAAILAKTTCRQLVACLASLKEHVDRVVILDTGSEDGCYGIAREGGAELHSSNQFYRNTHPFDFHFAAARNELLDLCVDCDWVLSIDTDERLNMQHDSRMENVLSHLVCATQQVYVVHEQEDGDAITSLSPRLLFMRGDVRPSWRYRCHEMPTPLDALHAVPLTRMFIAHDGSFIEPASLKRNLLLLQRQLAESAVPEEERKTHFELGRTFQGLDRYRCAIAHYRAWLSYPDIAPPDLMAYVWFLMGQSYEELGDIDRAMECYQASLSCCGEHTASRLALIHLFEDQDKRDEALEEINIVRGQTRQRRFAWSRNGQERERDWLDSTEQRLIDANSRAIRQVLRASHQAS